jgi:glutamate dehydrogenase
VANSLLAEAAQAAEAAGGGAIGVGDLERYLDAYYRHIAAEDLLAAGPQRVGAVAVEHARVAARRPQGRALVRVRAAGESAALDESRGVVDIVTDDMPFLVDSITIELARHNLDSYHIVHPQLLVRRDVTGELWEVVGQPTEGGRGHDEIAESWMHIEIDTAGADLAGLEDDLRRVLADVRVAVEDHQKMVNTALRLADQLAAEGVNAPAETQALLRWLADNHFTFLGYREYNLLEGPDGMALQAVPGTGLGILRHDKTGSSSFRRPAARGARPGQGPAAADLDQGQFAVHRAPALLPGLHRDQTGQRERRDQRGVPVPRALHARRLPREHHPDPGAAAQADQRAGARPGWPRTATTART